jgi:hypothetical protein
MVKAGPADANAPSITHDLVNFVCKLDLDDVPQSAIERTKSLILDGIACGLVAAHLSWSETGTQAVLDFESPGPCSVWGWDKVRTLSQLVLLSVRNVDPERLTESWAFSCMSSQFKLRSRL